MKRSIVPVASALALALSALTSSAVARADASIKGPVMQTRMPGVSSTPHDVITYEESMPNGALIGSGLTMFGASYIPSMIVAAASDHPGDTALYIPVAGPWIDLANRDSGCPGGHCYGDAANKVLLVANGVFQGLGTLQILGGFLFPTTRTVTQVAGVHVIPSVSSDHLGLTAVGRF
jgi:hypothetical protein